MSINDEDKQLFHDSVKGVKPLAQDKRPLRKIKNFLARKPAPSSYQEESPHYSIDPGSYTSVSPEENLFFARPHLSPKQLRQLRQGKIRLQAQCDLHGKTVAETAVALDAFIAYCQAQHIKTALIIHGKGNHTLSAHSALKSYVNAHLRQDPRVLAFCSAKPYHGGTGAMYVLVKQI